MTTLLPRAAHVAGVGVVIVVAVALLLWVLRFEPGRTPGIRTDALGPESGEEIAGYLERAAGTMEEEAAGEPRWALVSFDDALTPVEAAEALAPAGRVSRIYAQTPRDGAAMPVLWRDLAEPVGAEPADQGPAGPDRAPTFARALEVLAAGAERDAAEPGRASDLLRAGARELAGGGGAVIGAVALAPTTDLRAVAAAPRVRAVEALPADARWGRFAVRPLLPQQTDRADPLRDDPAAAPG